MSWIHEAARAAAFLIALLVAVSVAAPADALTLLDLAEGDRIVSGNGVVYENFQVKVKGKLTRDLAGYEVIVMGQGFAVTGDEVTRGRGRRAGKGKIQLEFDVSSAAGLESGAFGVLPGQVDPSGLSVTSTLFGEGKKPGKAKKLGKLKAGLGDPFAEMELGGLAALHVRQKIKLGGGFGGASVGGGFAPVPVPEPSTFVLMGLGLAAVSALRRTRM